jgi:hypothetical protein
LFSGTKLVNPEFVRFELWVVRRMDKCLLCLNPLDNAYAHDPLSELGDRGPTILKSTDSIPFRIDYLGEEIASASSTVIPSILVRTGARLSTAKFRLCVWARFRVMDRGEGTSGERGAPMAHLISG